MGSPSRNVQYHPPRLSEDRLNLAQPHSPSLPTHCTAPGNRECAHLGPDPDRLTLAQPFAELTKWNRGRFQARGGNGLQQRFEECAVGCRIEIAPDHLSLVILLHAVQEDRDVVRGAVRPVLRPQVQILREQKRRRYRGTHAALGRIGHGPR